MKKKAKKKVPGRRFLKKPGKERKSLKINKLSRKKSTTPSVQRRHPQAAVSHSKSTPRPGTYYGDNKIVLLIRDPWWLYCYWEVTQQREDRVQRDIHAQKLTREKTVLRVYDITGASLEKPNCFFDIELDFFAESWTIDVGKPDREWVVELGVRTTVGRFFVLVRSNTVRTPRFGPSDVLDEEWMFPEEISRRLFALSGAERGASSLDFRKLWGLWGRSSDLTRKSPAH